jgi:hypothetical protein
MMQIYYDDGVNSGVCVHTCSTLEEAKGWINEQLKGYTVVDDDHMCSEDVVESAKTALYEVFDGEPIIIKEHGEPNFEVPVYVSGLFYTE